MQAIDDQADCVHRRRIGGNQPRKHSIRKSGSRLRFFYSKTSQVPPQYVVASTVAHTQLIASVAVGYFFGIGGSALLEPRSALQPIQGHPRWVKEARPVPNTRRDSSGGDTL